MNWQTFAYRKVSSTNFFFAPIFSITKNIYRNNFLIFN